MAASSVNPATLDKLLHPIQEIRVRSLHDIENTLKRALWDNADFAAIASPLFKNLIRWFGHVPIVEQVTVLELMSLLLESKYGKDILTFFTPARIIKELMKIRCLIGSNQEYDELVVKLIKQVERIKSSTSSTTSTASSSSSTNSIDLDSVASSLGSLRLDRTNPPTNGRAAEAGAGGGERSPNGATDGERPRRRIVIDTYAKRWKDDPTLFTECWEMPEFSVELVLRRLHDSLYDDPVVEHFERGVNYIVPYTKSYPPEFFLQSPYLGLSLLHMIESGQIGVRRGYGIVLQLVESFRKRIRQRMLTVTQTPLVEAVRPRTQLSLGAFIYELFRLCIEQLKGGLAKGGELDALATNMIMIVLSQTISFLMTEHLADPQRIPPHRYRELCGEFGLLVRHYRQEWERSDGKNQSARTRYRIALQLMLDFLRLWQKEPAEPSSAYGGGVDEKAAAAAGGRTMPYRFAGAKTGPNVYRKAVMESDKVWRDECQLALLDYPLKVACPVIYDHLTTHMRKGIDLLLDVVVRLREKLVPAVELLRDGSEMVGKLSDEQLLLKGSEAIRTLGYHRSIELVRCILKAVKNCAGSVTEDGPLWDVIESITVRLLAHEGDQIRCEVYELFAEMMRNFVVERFDNEPIMSRRNPSSSNAPKVRAIGMPLSLQIVTEITCFGLSSKNKKIRECAESMLLYMLNAKGFLYERWIDVHEILLPIAPLLQTAAVGREDSKLRKAVINMFHPDAGLPWLDILQGNLRLLFHEESTVREEALTRVLFLLSSVEESEKFAPRIEHISDTIPNGVCLLSFPYDIGRQQVANVYEVSAVKPLLDALEQEGGDPTLRRSALTQLNVMADDPALCSIIHNESGWVLVLQALYNSLLADPVLDYPDAAIPAVGILTKLCFRETTFRRFLGSNANAYQLIVRALLTHHHMPVFRVECCALLYLLLFADCSTGNGPLISLPQICASSAFKLPFVTNFHWQTSPFREYGTDLEQMIKRIGYRRDPDAPDRTMTSGGDAEEKDIFPTSRFFRWEFLLRYIRFTFADLWFDGLEKILLSQGTVKRAAGGASTAAEDDECPLVYGGNPMAMEFSAHLRLTKHDLRWLKVIDFPAIFRTSLRRIGSTKAHADVYEGLASLEANVTFPLRNTVCQQDVIITTLKRYVHTPPVTIADQELLVEVLNIIGMMMRLNFRMVWGWLMMVLEMKDNFFLRLLRSEDCIEPLYVKNANLLLGVLQFYDGPEDQVTAEVVPIKEDIVGKKERGSAEKHQQQQQRHHQQQQQQQQQKQQQQQHQQQQQVAKDWDVRIFVTVIEQLEVMVKKCDLPRIMALLEVLVMIASALDDVRRVDLKEVIPKLLLCVRQVGSTSYTGSAIVRLCLLTVARLLEDIPDELGELEWNAKTLKTVSTQCGNSCTFVRSFAWNILAKVAHTQTGAAAIVKECAYLPGGIHASCISTILDNGEACLVRESAVGLFVNLLSHTEKDGSLHPTVLPLDEAANRQRAVAGIASAHASKRSDELIMELLAKQRFFEVSAESLWLYTCMEFLVDDDGGRIRQRFISADMVRSFAVLYRALVELEPIGFGKLIFEKGCIQWLLDCVEQQAMLPNRAVCLMVVDVCLLLQRCMDEPNRESLCNLLASHQNFIESIIYMLNPWLYGKLTEPVMEQTLCYIMRFLCTLVGTPTGKQQIHQEFGHQDLKPIARTIEMGISHESKPYQTMCLKFLCHMFYTSDERPSPTAEYPTFLIQFEQMNLAGETPEAAKLWKPNSVFAKAYSESEDDSDNSVVGDVGEKAEQRLLKTNGEKDGLSLGSGSAQIFYVVMGRFKSFCNRDQLEPGAVTSSSYKCTVYSALQTMLHFSGEACRVARMYNLFGIIMDWFDVIHEELIGRLTYAEFVRKYGDVKKLMVMAELKELASVLGTWFSVPNETCQLEQDQINQLCQTVLLYWPWFTNHSVLQMEFLQVLAFLTESQITVCKALAATFPGHPHSILKLLVVSATAETAKVKGPKYDLQLLRVSLRLLKNCCCCHEGRSLIGKQNVFGNISKLHPTITKLQKPWIEVTQLWLEFYEVYTRYLDVNEMRHLTVLGALIRKSDADIRMLAMAIVRNFTFVQSNRSALLASADYMYILQNGLQRTASKSEVLMAAVAVWKMVANNQRGKAAIKSSPLVRLIEGQVKHYSMTPEGNDQNELWCVLMTVYHILKA